MIFNLSEINLIVLQYIQQSLREDYQNSLINFQLSNDVAQMILSTSIPNLRNLSLDSRTPLFTLQHANNQPIWNDYLSSLTSKSQAMHSIFEIRAHINKMEQPTL